MKLLIFILTLVSFPYIALAAIQEKPSAELASPANEKPCFSEAATEKDFPNLFLARRGCCSHHSGVCGCRGNRQECCDGTLSPSCRCFAPTPLQEESLE